MQTLRLHRYVVAMQCKMVIIQGGDIGRSGCGNGKKRAGMIGACGTEALPPSLLTFFVAWAGHMVQIRCTDK